MATPIISAIVYKHLMETAPDLAEEYKTKTNPPTIPDSAPTLLQLFNYYQENGPQNGWCPTTKSVDSIDMEEVPEKITTTTEARQPEKQTKKDSSEDDSDSEDEPPPKKQSLAPKPLNLVKHSVNSMLADSNNSKPKSRESMEIQKWENIISILELKDQKACRLVSKFLNQVTRTVMLKQDKCQISIEYFESGDRKKNTHFSTLQIVPNRDYGGHTLTDGTVSEKKSLRELTSCLKNSINFPCSSFGFSWCDLSQNDVGRFFAVYGPQIKSLALHESSYVSNRTPLNYFREILQNQAPNIEKFQLNGFAYKWADRDDLYLPNLSHLVFEKYWGSSAGDLKTKKQLLQAANNLKTVHGFQLDLIDIFSQTEKMHTIKSFVCSSDISKIELNTFTKFANAEPQLNLFSFGFEPKSSLELLENQLKLTSPFNNILLFSKDSLQELKIGDFYYMTNVKIPKLQNLKKLSLLNTRSPMWDGTFFPGKLNLNEIFPNVKTLYLGLIELEDNRWIRDISLSQKFVGNLSSVKTLEISKLWDKEWQETLSIMCPNFNILRVHCSSNSFKDRWDSKSDFLTRIHKVWPHLEGLELIITDDEEMPNLDSILTGLSWQNCEKLAPNKTPRSQQKPQKPPQVSEMARGPSITDFKKLKDLKILFDLKTTQEGETVKTVLSKWEPISMVSVIHAFKLIRGLKVTLGWDFGQNHYSMENFDQKALAPFVNFVHFKNSEVS